MKISIQVLFFWCCMPLAVSAQYDASARFDSATIATGMPFVLHLHAPLLPKNIDFSSWQPFLPDSNCLRTEAWEQDINGDGWHQDRVYIAFDSADLQLPALSLTLQDGSTVATNPVSIQIIPTPAPTDLNDMAGIKDIHREPFSLWALLWALRYVLLIILLGLLLLGGLIYLIWRVFRRKKAVLGAISLSPQALALQQLDELSRRQLWQQGHIKNYYDALTHIARTYIQGQYGIRALEYTTDEALAAVRASGLSPATISTLERLLTWGDLAKFAKQSPPETYHAAALEEVRRIVEQ